MMNPTNQFDLCRGGRRRCMMFIPAVVATLLFAGCEGDQIVRYQVPKPVPRKVLAQETGTDTQQAGPKDRMIAAMIPQGDQAWFFKLSGPDEVVEPQMPGFLSLIKSVRFVGTGDGGPDWTLPEGWQQQPGSGMRYATITIESAGTPLELSVMRLPSVDVIANVNRWRDQLGLPPTTAEKLYSSETPGEEVVRVPLDGTEAVLVNLVGRLKQSRMGRPFASGRRQMPRPASPAGDDPKNDASVKPAPPSALTYDTPEQWSPGRVGGMRKAAFIVEDAGSSVEITAIDLAPGAGDLLSNVNRWRQQVGLEAVTLETLNEQLKQIDVNKKKANYVELVGSTETILSVITIDAGQAWFFKLKGDNDLAAREKERFEQFVRSVNFGQNDGAESGK